MGIHFYFHSQVKQKQKNNQKCLDEVKAVKDLEREVLKGTEKFSEITSKESPSQLSDDSATRWCQTNLRTHLRRDPRSLESFLGKRHSRCRYLHRARQEEDCHRS